MKKSILVATALGVLMPFVYGCRTVGKHISNIGHLTNNVVEATTGSRFGVPTTGYFDEDGNPLSETERMALNMTYPRELIYEKTYSPPSVTSIAGHNTLKLKDNWEELTQEYKEKSTIEVMSKGKDGKAKIEEAWVSPDVMYEEGWTEGEWRRKENWRERLVEYLNPQRKMPLDLIYERNGGMGEWELKDDWREIRREWLLRKKYPLSVSENEPKVPLVLIANRTPNNSWKLKDNWEETMLKYPSLNRNKRIPREVLYQRTDENYWVWELRNNWKERAKEYGVVPREKPPGYLDFRQKEPAGLDTRIHLHVAFFDGREEDEYGIPIPERSMYLDLDNVPSLRMFAFDTEHPNRDFQEALKDYRWRRRVEQIEESK